MKEVNTDVPQAESPTTTRNGNAASVYESRVFWGATGSTRDRHADEIVEA